jgi:hypothetical protein
VTHGAIAQGVGQALLEHAVYDPASRQLLAGSLMDYALPRVDDLPSYEVGFNGFYPRDCSLVWSRHGRRKYGGGCRRRYRTARRLLSRPALPLSAA